MTTDQIMNADYIKKHQESKLKRVQPQKVNPVNHSFSFDFRCNL